MDTNTTPLSTDERQRKEGRLGEEVGKTAEQTREKLDSFKDDLKDKARDYKDDAEQHWEDLSASAQEKLRQGKRRIRETGEKMDAYTKENPWRAVGIAASLGVLVGMLLRRGNRR